MQDKNENVIENKIKTCLHPIWLNILVRLKCLIKLKIILSQAYKNLKYVKKIMILSY